VTKAVVRAWGVAGCLWTRTPTTCLGASTQEARPHQRQHLCPRLHPQRLHHQLLLHCATSVQATAKIVSVTKAVVRAWAVAGCLWTRTPTMCLGASTQEARPHLRQHLCRRLHPRLHPHRLHHQLLLCATSVKAPGKIVSETRVVVRAWAVAGCLWTRTPTMCLGAFTTRRPRPRPPLLHLHRRVHQDRSRHARSSPQTSALATSS